MKLDVKFSESNQSFAPKLSGSDKTFGAKYSGVQTIHGRDGKDGIDGESAYEIAVKNGFDGTETEWLKSLRGKTGDKGDPFTYEDFTQEQLNSLKGNDGYTPIKGKDYFDGKDGKDGYTPKKGVDYFDGKDGADGKTPVKGTDYWTEADKQEIAEEAASLVEIPESLWEKADGENGIRLKGTGGSASGNYAISAGDDKTASNGTEYKSVASGDHAVSFGYGNTCSGRTTLAQGLYNTVTAKDAVAFGQRNTVQGEQSFAAGMANEITARNGIALGYGNKVTYKNGVAMGWENIASGDAAVAMGDACESSGVSAVAMGYQTKASGSASVTLGRFTKTTGAGEAAMGEYNQSVSSGDPAQQTAFSFGNGTSDTKRANAFEIKKNGDVYFGGTKFVPFTEAEIVTAVIAALPVYGGETE